jgi:polysaccharide biosynthesis/export protein
MITRYGFTAALFVLLSFRAFAQQPQPPGAPGQAPPVMPPVQGNQAQPGEFAVPIRPDYVLGPNDQILIRAPGVDEINERPFRIDTEGFVNLPLIGRLRVAGLTVQQLETELVTRLREYIVQPVVSVSVVQFRSEPVFFVGAFLRPGIYPLQGRRTLVEMISSVGGLQPKASRRIRVTRRAEYDVIPLPGATQDPEKKTSSVEISMGTLRENINPAEDIVLKPYDVISVDRAELVYVSGEVTKVGGLELEERDSVSVLQALAMSGGYTRDADRTKLRILRPIMGTARRGEINVDMKSVLEGKANDFPLLPNDVIYVPRSFKRVAWTGIATFLLPTLPYIIITLTR